MSEPDPDIIEQAQRIVAAAEHREPDTEPSISDAVRANLDRFLGFRRRGMTWREITKINQRPPDEQ